MVFCTEFFWMGGGLESPCVGRVYGADGAVHHPQASACNTDTNYYNDARSNKYKMLLVYLFITETDCLLRVMNWIFKVLFVKFRLLCHC